MTEGHFKKGNVHAFSSINYLIIHADSTVNFSYKPAEDIRTFLIDYERQFCIEDRELLPLVYYISKVRAILPVFNWGIRDNCQNALSNIFSPCLKIIERQQLNKYDFYNKNSSYAIH